MKDVKEITKELEQGVKDTFASEAYKEYLRFMAGFTHYSANNCWLIWKQMPDATLVAGYKAWQEKGRQVRKGETGLTILAPNPKKFMKRREDEDGNVTEEEIKVMTFRAISVFDVSQTDGEEIPEHPCKTLDGSVEGFESLLNKLMQASPVPVAFEDIQTGANGFFAGAEGRIVVKAGMGQAQTIKTLVHEIAHAILHGKDGEEAQADRSTKEVQAESVAYTVCCALGLDTGEYSFGYVAGWSKDQEAKELCASLEIIRKTAKQIIEGAA